MKHAKIFHNLSSTIAGLTMDTDTKLRIPSKLPVLLVTDGVVFPAATMRIPVKAKQNIMMVEECLMNIISLKSAIVAIVYRNPPKELTQDQILTNKESDVDRFCDIHPIATAGVGTQVVGTNWPRPSYTLQITGLCRVRINRIVKKQPFMWAQVTQLDKMPGQTITELDDATTKAFKEGVSLFLKTLSPRNSAVIQLKKIYATASMDVICDLCASLLNGSYPEKLSILDSLDMNHRVHRVLALMKRHMTETEDLTDDKSLTVEIFPESVRVDELTKLVNSVFGRGREGGGGGRAQAALPQHSEEEDAMELKLKEAGMPPEVHKVVMSEYKKFKHMSTFSAEYSSLRNYLELMAELPWAKETTDTWDVPSARKQMDVDHFGLEDVKKRVLEFLAVRKLKKNLKGPILCFVGPPGVGKTSIARSIAKTMGRKFHRISLGGVCDQSDLRGHRRTYVGSMPGRIIQGLKNVQTRNPVFLLDEIEKMSPGVHGDPSAALLEVLDPEQNFTFVDHYVNTPFDLSQVLFLATANTLIGVPAPLRDRMEVIKIPGYTMQEKVRIAERHLVPKQLEDHGLSSHHVSFYSSVIRTIGEKYTKEAGVRSLERKIGAVCRAVALKVAESEGKSAVDSVATHNSTIKEFPVLLDDAALDDILGTPVYVEDRAEYLSQPGVAAGLAVSEFGGSVLYVEATKMEGEGRLTLTGHLGSVMKESAQLALNWLRSHPQECGLKSVDLLEKTDIHIHFPEGATSKDGPSAGVTVLVTLVSLFSGNCVQSDVAMTGEITLRGLVLPVGGIKDKVLAAHRAGFKRVVLPKKNEKDLNHIPSEIHKDLKICMANTMEDVLRLVFDGDQLFEPKGKL